MGFRPGRREKVNEWIFSFKNDSEGGVSKREVLNSANSCSFSFKDDSVRRSLVLILNFFNSVDFLLFIVKPTSPLEESRLRTVELFGFC